MALTYNQAMQRVTAGLPVFEVIEKSGQNYLFDSAQSAMSFSKSGRIRDFATGYEF